MVVFVGIESHFGALHVSSMAMAFLTAQRSKDPNTQVGACIVDEENRIIGLGYNGFPSGCSDDLLPWARSNSNGLNNKYLYVCHAEVNAILNKGSANVKGATIYVALFPCQNCAKMIIQSGIKEVVFMSDAYHDTPGCRASRIMFRCAAVKLRQYIPSMKQLVLDLGKSRGSH
jgi:dCMP deaminase